MRRWTCLLCLFSLFPAVCSRVSDHVVLLPGPDGRTGVLSITTASGAAVLAEPYTGVDVAGGWLSRFKTSPRMVRDAYGRLLDMQPARPRLLVFYFATGSNALTPESQSRLAEVRGELASLPAGEAIVIGHTDRVGGTEANDQLSLRRTELLRDLLGGRCSSRGDRRRSR